MRRPLTPNVPIEAEGAEEIGNRVRACPPPQPVPVRGRLCQFVEGWKHIMSDPCVLSIIARGYKLRFMSPPLLLKTPWEIISPQGPQNVRANIPDASKECDNRRTSDTPGFYSNVFLVRKASGWWHPVIVLKQLNAQI